ncbi:MAG: hypothetical protein AAB467_01275 [Patescibacteria group bacterium]
MFKWFKGLLAALMWSKIRRKVGEEALNPEPAEEQSVEEITPVPVEEVSVAPPLPPESQSDTCSVVKREGPMVVYKCGHRDHERPTFNLYGEIITFTATYNKARRLCTDCILANTLSSIIRCGACGRAIMIGAGVSIRRDVNRMKKEWQTKVIVDGQNGALACTRSDCCPSPEKFLFGYWTGTSIEPRTSERPNQPPSDDPKLRN